MRLSRIWRILQFKEDVIHRGRRNNSYRKDFASFHHSKPISSPRFTPAIFSTPHTFWTDMSYFYYLIPFSLFFNAKVAKTVFLNVINSAYIACCLFILINRKFYDNCRNSRSQTHELIIYAMRHRARANNLTMCCRKNKLTTVFYTSVLLLIMNFVITLSNPLWQFCNEIHDPQNDRRMKNWL